MYKTIKNPRLKKISLGVRKVFSNIFGEHLSKGNAQLDNLNIRKFIGSQHPDVED